MKMFVSKYWPKNPLPNPYPILKKSIFVTTLVYGNYDEFPQNRQLEMENTLAIAGFGPFVVFEIVVWCKKFFKQR
jgi:hypothetical protein